MESPYDAIADAWHAHDREFRAKGYVDMLLDRLEPGARVLDVGCGTGLPIARYVAGRGFRVTGVDASAKMLAIARRTVPEATFLHADMLELPDVGPFAAVVAWDSVFHVDRRRHAGLYGRIRDLLEDGGWLLLSAGGTGHEGFTSEMFGHTFFYSGYEPDETVRLLEAAGFTVELCEVDDPSSRGHVAIVARATAHG
jgi:cyclopropane fatty-acyl-phospholipid synthase-like methyltransferase